MTLLKEEDFKKLIDSGEHLASKRLKEGMKDVPVGDHEKLINELIEDEHAFWEARGVDVEALQAYCLWEGEDTVRIALRAADVPEDLVDNESVRMAISPVMLRALIASSVEMAFSVGWHMHDRMLSKVSH